ncbi:hypothetical protein [Oricola thermophila]|uniref:Uncharacterized protein n=1 Tax=Oricola thermophila TaxID=2742145 RepID=A0A6N1VCL3_9HYPH|nr:hypothetical protein [Oricola thermophila]QKV18736.1 hypothetical protein HTY61_09885 [Oricola thermophila]
MTIDLYSINSMPAGRVLPEQVGPDAVEAYGRSFPDPETLAAMPRAMRREAALLAAEAGLDAPKGSLPARTAVLPWRPAGAADNRRRADNGESAGAGLLRAFIADCLRFRPAESTGWISCADIHALHCAWCRANGHEPAESRILGMMIGDRVARERRGHMNGYRGLVLSEVAAFYKSDVAIVPEDDEAVRVFARECLAPGEGWVSYAALQDALAGWCAMKRWPQPPAAIFRHALVASGARPKRGSEGHSGYSGISLSALGEALAGGRAAARSAAQ